MSVQLEASKWDDYKIPSFSDFLTIDDGEGNGGYQESQISNFIKVTDMTFDGWEDRFGRHFEDGQVIPHNYLGENLILSAVWRDQESRYFNALRKTENIAYKQTTQETKFTSHTNYQVSSYLEFSSYGTTKVSRIIGNVFRVNKLADGYEDNYVLEDDIPDKFYGCITKSSDGGNSWDQMTEYAELTNGLVNFPLLTQDTTLSNSELVRLSSNVQYPVIYDYMDRYTNVGIMIYLGGNYVKNQMDFEDLYSLSSENGYIDIETNRHKTGIFGKLKSVEATLVLFSRIVSVKYPDLNMSFKCRLQISDDGNNWTNVTSAKTISVTQRDNLRTYRFNVPDEFYIRDDQYLRLLPYDISYLSNDPFYVFFFEISIRTQS